jgi:type III restriction enzyme
VFRQSRCSVVDRAKALDQRADIKLFVKHPAWFEIDTPIGKYNPGWATLKQDEQALYLVRETKATRDFPPWTVPD